MARKPKRSETLSIRITPELKDQLTIAAAFTGSSVASVVEQAVISGMEQAKIPLEFIGSEHLRSAFSVAGWVPISQVYQCARHSEPLIMQLRLYHLMPEGLTEKERVICETIVGTEKFHGSEPIFDDRESLRAEGPSIDIEAAQNAMGLLERYADYKLHEMQRPDGLSLSFSDYLKLLQKSSSLQVYQTEDGGYSGRIVASNGQILATAKLEAKEQAEAWASSIFAI